MAIDQTPAPNLLFDILIKLEQIGAPYMVVGAFAALIYGGQRTTYDIDIIDTSLGDKADLVPLRREPQERSAFRRRLRQPLELPGGQPLQIWCARPEDVIIGKLAAWTEGGSRKHESDILQMLIYQALENPGRPLERQAIAVQAARMGEATLRLWNTLERKAAEEAAKRQGRG